MSGEEAEEIFKIKQNGGFSLFFLLFGKALYIPKIMSLLPSSPKIITRAPQLPENKQPFSPDPQNPWRAPPMA